MEQVTKLNHFGGHGIDVEALEIPNKGPEARSLSSERSPDP